MSTQIELSRESGNQGRKAPFFVMVLTLLVIALLLVSLGSAYAAERKTILLISLVFIGITGLFAVRDVKPYLLGTVVFVTSTSVDYYLSQEYTVNFHSTVGFYFHIIFFPILVLWFLLVAGILTGRNSFSVKHTGFVPLMAYALFAFLSIQQSVAPKFTQYELFSLSACLLLYILLTNIITEKRQVFFILLAIGAVVGFQGLVAIAQYIKGSDLGLQLLGEAQKLTVDTSLSSGVRRASGTMGYPNTLALLLDLTLPVVAGLTLVTQRLLLRIAFGAATMVGGIASIITVSRAGLAAAVISVGLVVLYWGYRTRRLFAVIFVLMLVGSIVLAGIVLTDNPIRDRLFQENDDSSASRIPMMEVAQNVIANNFWFGVGLNNYTDVAQQYDGTSMRISAVFPYPVHNTPMLIWAEVGFIGFFGFMVFFIGRVMKGFALAADENKDYSILGFAMGVGLSLFMLHLLVDYTYISSSWSFWLMCGLVTGLYRLRKSESLV